MGLQAMNEKLNKTDYILLGLYYSITNLLRIQDYYASDKVIIEYLFDITILMSLCLVFSFGFWLIPKYIVTNKRYRL